MKRLGIKYQILLITLIPVFLIDLFFTFNYINTNISQANELMQTKGQIIARQIAGASEFNLFTGNDGQIKYLLEQSVDTNDIVQASVYDRAGRLIAYSESELFDESDITEYFYVRQPILSQSIQHSDVFAPDFVDDQQTSTLGLVHLYISRQQLQQTTRQIILDSIIFFVAVLIMAFGLTVVISRRITQPIIRLMEHLKFVETGQLGKTIETVEDNEIGSLQKGFNRMTQALLANRRHLNQRIQQATQQLNEAITDLEAKNRELGFARDEAQNANRTKSDFLANMSHEIRTPINGIKGFISLLSQSNLDRTQQRYVDIILKSTGDLTNIVNEILDFSKMESGKLQIVDEEFDLYEVIEQTRDLLFINVLTKNIDLNLIIFSDTPRRVIGDKLRIKQVLLNLIGNAVKFTDQGRVVIKVSVDDIREQIIDLKISIADSGIGISEEDQQNLFQAFSQVESSDSRRYSGTGLGLVISKNLATLMGGDISMQSEFGKGSTFVFHLPLKFIDHDESNVLEPAPTALIFAADEICLMETRTLFDRAKANTEVSLIDNELGPEPLRETIQRNLHYIDLLVFDLRHLEINLEHAVEAEVVAATRIIVMHYDQGADLAGYLTGAEFISLINTSQALNRIISGPQELRSGLDPNLAVQKASRKRILLVDDNQINLKLASELIRLWGHEVTEAEHGNRAFELYRAHSFDLIILDIQMPDVDGVSLMQMMRQHNPQDPAPIVALTANILNDEAERLLELGFDYFLSKPIDEGKFRALLDGDPPRRSAAQLTSDNDSEQECSLDYQRSLALSAGNESLLQQIFEILQRDIPDQQQQLARAFSTQDYDKLAAIAHKLNGVTCYAGLPRLRHQVLAFQQRLAHDSNASINGMIEDLQLELSAVKHEVDRHVAQMSANQPS